MAPAAHMLPGQFYGTQNAELVVNKVSFCKARPGQVSYFGNLLQFWFNPVALVVTSWWSACETESAPGIISEREGV